MSKPPADVSAIIPFYNSSATLQRAIDSVLDQTVQVREIIVVDDASDPEESRRAAAMVARTANSRAIVLEANSGPGEARNAGWDAATGAWIAFLDSDDAWHHRKIEYQVRVLESIGEELVFVASQRRLVKNVQELDSISIPETPEIKELTTRRFLLRNWTSTPTVMLRRDIPVRFPADRRYAEDHELWLLVASLGKRMIRIESPLVGLFKSAYGDAGLSASVWRMIRGEYQAYLGAFRAGATNLPATMLGLIVLSCRVIVRLARLGCASAVICSRTRNLHA